MVIDEGLEAKPTVDQVRNFYDEFTRTRMVEYRIRGNARIDAAVNRIKPLLHPGFRVLDVGCGIGIVSERLARLVPEGTVLAVDLSPNNIWYAEQTTKAPNLKFSVLDVASEMESVREKIGGLADVVVLVDVIEHVPESDRLELFQKLRALSSRRSWLIMTYPSPQYQRYLQSTNPDELQIVDNVVELDVLIQETRRAGYHLKHYSLEDVWMANQYCHVVFQTDDSLERGSPATSPPGLIRTVGRHLLREVETRLLVPMRRRKYITSVFGR